MARKPKPLTEKFEAAFGVAKQQLGVYLDTRFTEEISAVKWAYPTPPQVRDIVDTGRLRASQTREVTEEGITFNWPVDYAQQVHDGGVSVRTRQPFPGRPWTHIPLSEAEAKLGEYLDQSLKKTERS